MKTKQALVPKLRFKKYGEAWCFHSLEDCCSKKISYGIVQAGPHIEGGMPYIKSQDLNREIEPDKLQCTSFEIAHKYRRSEVTPNDLVFSLRGNIGLARVVPPTLKVANLTQGTARLSIKDSARFSLYTLQTTPVNQRIISVSKGSTFQEISLFDLRKIQIPLPSLPEQEKIAEFLTSVDDRIDQLKRKKSLLQDYKKGVMQKLFSQELRFKDDHGKPYPDWEEKKLGEVYTYQSTNSYSRDKLNYESGEVYNIHYGDIHTKFRCHFHLSDEYVPYLNTDIDTDKIKPECYLQIGDIVLADASEDYADIGKSIEVIDLNKAQVVAGLHTYILRPDTSKISKGFGAYLMQARPTRLEVMRIAQGTKVLGLPKAYLSFITLNIPHPDEQTKIASFLSTLDQKIEQIDTQITQTQTFKKGLLQQMFV